MLEPLRRRLNQAVADGGRTVERLGSSDLVLVDGSAQRKCSGNALRVRRHAALYHGTLLDAFDIPLISRVLRHPPREPGYRARRPHGEFLANLGLGRSRLETLVREAFAAAPTRSLWPIDRVARLVRDRYADADWTRRL
jgi:lipoate-protein ligase A